MNHHDDQPGDQREHPAPEGVEGLSAQQGQTGPQAMPEGAGSRALAEALKTSFLFLKIAICFILEFATPYYRCIKMGFWDF